MRVLFASTRSAGHFRPLVPFIEACRRAGHEVLVAGPPALADTVQRAGYPFRVGAAPPEDDLGAARARIPTLSYDDAERLVVGEIFATLNVRAMLPHMRTALREWRPDVIVREHAEFASLVAAEEAGVPQLQVGISLAATHMRMSRSPPRRSRRGGRAWRIGSRRRHTSPCSRPRSRTPTSPARHASTASATRPRTRRRRRCRTGGPAMVARWCT
jgi:UDP:flavonoid glycosyltransferase YjiC (YdhE family)